MNVGPHVHTHPPTLRSTPPRTHACAQVATPWDEVKKPRPSHAQLVKELSPWEAPGRVAPSAARTAPGRPPWAPDLEEKEPSAGRGGGEGAAGGGGPVVVVAEVSPWKEGPAPAAPAHSQVLPSSSAAAAHAARRAARTVGAVGGWLSRTATAALGR
jgi:hypothetical protein